ncbi:N-alpha-acetyltransferase 50 isoform X1 [Lates japonicus]
MKGSRIELGDVTPHNIKQLKRLNQVIFPVSYNDKFYKDVLEVGELAKLAYFNDIAVGAVCCRVDHSQNQKRLYIMTLGCLAPYRRLGIGTKMLNHVLNICEKDGTFDNIYLHVQISNESAIDFYQKFGFEIIETKKNYYKRIEPADAHVLQKSLRSPCAPPHRRASEGRVGAHDGKEHRCARLHRNRTVTNAPGSTRSTLSSKDAKKRKQNLKYKNCCIYFAKGGPL